MKDDILLVDDDPSAIQSLARILCNVGTLRFATNGADAIRLAGEHAPDVMLLDAEMPGMSGFAVCQTLKEHLGTSHFPVIFVTSHDEPGFEIMGFEIGAADFITKPVIAALVQARVGAQLKAKHMADELRRIATVDVMTGLYNRRQFDNLLESECRRAHYSDEPLALLMIDVDHFKAYNDRYGHPAGDQCLSAVAKALTSACFRRTDVVARYGGEEFVILLPQTQRRDAEMMALRALDAIVALDIRHDGSPVSRHVTVSVGVACAAEVAVAHSPLGSRFDEDSLWRACGAELVDAADKAMYAAKHAGRGRARMMDTADERAHTRNVADDRRSPPTPTREGRFRPARSEGQRPGPDSLTLEGMR
jgi:diguanylate cyclase (GGDEF)-like protein